MKKYWKPAMILLFAIILFLMTIDGVMHLEKLNFLVEPYFLLCLLSVILLIISLIHLVVYFIYDIIFYIKKNKS